MGALVALLCVAPLVGPIAYIVWPPLVVGLAFGYLTMFALVVLTTRGRTCAVVGISVAYAAVRGFHPKALSAVETALANRSAKGGTAF